MNQKRDFFLIRDNSNNAFFSKNRRGQIWVETVIYTLIAFSLMGLVLAFVVPKVNETRDKGVIEQSMGVLGDIDGIIRNLGGPGNQRVPQVGINKGTMTIDAINDRIYFEMESRYQYSQPGEDVNVERVTVHTEGEGKINIVTLTLNYAGEKNIKYMGQEEVKVLSKAPVPYGIAISDRGPDSDRKTIINMEVI